MIYVNNLNNQLNVIFDTRKDVYAFDSIKSVSFSWDTKGDYYIIINFIANDKNNSLRIYLKDVDPTLSWGNNFTGATYAVDIIASWMGKVIEVNINESNDSILIYGSDGAVNHPILVNGSGAIAVQDNGGSITVDGGTGLARTPGVIRPTGSGNVSSAAATFFSVSVANVGAANGTVLASLTTIKPGEVLNFSADAINNYFTSFAYNATGTEFIIIYVA